MEKLRSVCLKRGAAGIKGFSRQFKIMDDDGSKSINFDEFKKGCHDFGLKQLTEEELKEMFAEFDEDGSGSVIFDEFIAKLRPPLNEARLRVIKLAFNRADKTGDGILTVQDLKGIYNARKHPKYLNGEWDEKEVFESFLKSFEPESSTRDGQVTFDEFLAYYSGVSHSIDGDAYFDLMMRNAWKI